jgi:phosphatidylserine/phosphatidylglycerophosphate/cardiolipin synthase-like enzyme
VCVIDDTWATVGSDNVNRRSWTHDSEVSCAVVDQADSRFAGDLRRFLWAEHLGLSADDPDLRDARRGFEVWQHSARRLDEWHEHHRGARPVGRARSHAPESSGSAVRAANELLYRGLLDPDGRPLGYRRSGRY